LFLYNANSNRQNSDIKVGLLRPFIIFSSIYIKTGTCLFLHFLYIVYFPTLLIGLRFVIRLIQ